jgi:23S rRNA (uracil1939-C5)-methyltransferase
MTDSQGVEDNRDVTQAAANDMPTADGDSGDGALIELELNDLAYGGDAVGRYQGRAVFVPGGLPGEFVRAELVRERSNYARAHLVEVLRRSPDRVEERYPEFAESGGFQWQHLRYDAQLGWKARIVHQLLMRIGHFTNPPVAPTIGMPAGSDPWRYRAVAQFAVGPDGAIGFRRGGSHDVLDMPSCPIIRPELNEVYQQVREWMRATWGADAARYTERFTLRVAVAAVGPGPRALELDHGAALLAIETRPGSTIDADGGPIALGEALMAAAPQLVGVVILGLPGGRGRVVVGQDFVYDRVLDKEFRISAGSFFQVNAEQTPVLVEQAIEALRPHPNDLALDGYSGVGLFSLFLADHVRHVHAIESQPSAVADARASAAINNVINLTVTEGVLERVLGALTRQNERYDLVLLDPPRAGCHPRAIAEIKAMGPRRVVYVSCDPSTLARDLQIFCSESYRLVHVQPVDMFPFTSHIECVALIERMR